MRGGADDSFGIEVAKLAGIPDRVIHRAKQILKEMEGDGQAASKKRAERAQPQEEPAQITFAPAGEQEALRRLREMDVNTLTPIECMNQLFELSRLLKD